MLQDVKPEHTFWLKTGKGIKNTAELGRELKQMSNEVFSHHVNEGKNDFAEWTKLCVKDEKLAALLKTTKNRQRAAAIVERRIQEMTIPKYPSKQQKETAQPSIIRTKNVTMLSFEKEPVIVKTESATLEKTIVNSPNKTHLHLSTNKPEIYVHEVKPHHYSAIILASYITLGIVVGMALTILTLTFL